MRRGLISHARLELPDAVLDARLARVRAAMAEARLDALVLYSNNTRAAGVSWLTGFVPYWSEALLVLVREAPPILVVALTYRVKGWIERTSRVADVIHGPRIGREAARVIAGAKADAVVAVPGLDHLPAGIADDLRSGGPRLVLTDASSMFAPLRGQADATEIALATKAAWIAQRALACAELRRREPQCNHCRHRRGRSPAGGRGGLHRRRARSCARPALAPHRTRCALGQTLRAARNRRFSGNLDPARAHLRRA